MILLICGGRDFNDGVLFDWGLAFVKGAGFDTTVIISGGARGADAMAKDRAKMLRLPFHEFAADWVRHGKAAGHKRNTQMLVEGHPDLVLAMPGGAGTANMIKQARAANVRVCYFEPDKQVWSFV